MTRKTKKRIGRIILYLLVLTIIVFTVVPYLWLVVSSLSTKSQLTEIPLKWFPANPTFENYEAMLFGSTNITLTAAQDFKAAMGNSLFVTLAVVAISLVLGVLAAYAYSRFRFRGRGPLLNLTLFTQMIPPIAVIIPMYIILVNLGWIDSKFSLIMVYLSFVLPYLIWIMKGYIDGIPTELEEAAMIDGCGRLKSFVKVVLPIVSVGLAATVIFAFIISWNEFFYALNFTRTIASKTLPVLISDFNSKFGSNYVMSATAGVIASLPPVVIALVFQKYIISGLSAGAVKG